MPEMACWLAEPRILSRRQARRLHELLPVTLCLCQSLQSPTGNSNDELQEVTALDVLRSHIPEYVKSSCPAGCTQHFLCRACGHAHPESDLLNAGKYTKRLDMGWTDAEPTEIFAAADIVEVDDLKSCQTQLLRSSTSL